MSGRAPVTRSAICRPTAGPMPKPWPEKPLARWNPGRELTGPITIRQVKEPNRAKPAWIADFSLNLVPAVVRLANPLAETSPYLRTSLLPGLFAAVQRNTSRGCVTRHHEISET